MDLMPEDGNQMDTNCVLMESARNSDKTHPYYKCFKATAPKTLVEAKSDKLWVTGIQLHDPNVLKPDTWTGKGWMSKMLSTIHEKDIPITN